MDSLSSHVVLGALFLGLSIIVNVGASALVVCWRPGYPKISMCEDPS